MGKKERPKIDIQVELTEGYQQRFTEAIMKIYEKRRQKEEQEAMTLTDRSAG